MCHTLIYDAPFKFFDGLNYKSKSEDNGRWSWGMFPDSQQFRGRKACWSFEIGTKKIDKQFNYSHRLALTKQQVG
jgi:hypothetical protein